MTTQPPLTAAEVFTGLDFRTNDGREGCDFFFCGHLTAKQVGELYYAAYPDHRIRYPYVVDASSIRHAWHLFTAHEDTCYLIDDGGPNRPSDLDSILCTCAARDGLDGGPGYEYRHPHPATPDQPGAIPVTWATIGPA